MVDTVNILIVGLLAFALWHSYRESPIIRFLLPALFIKLLAGLIVGILYVLHYEQGDTLSFHEQAVVVSDLAYNGFGNFIEYIFTDQTPPGSYFTGEARTRLIIKILSIVHLVTGQSYWISSLYFSIFSFVGFWMVADTLARQYPTSKLTVIIAFLFFPSVVFWSSGILKESIAMGALMILTKIALDWIFYRKIKWSLIIIALPLVWLLWSLKYYYLGVYMTAMIPLLLVDGFQHYSIINKKKMLWYFISLIGVGTICTTLHPNFHLSEILKVIKENHDTLQMSSMGQSIEFSGYDGSLGSTLLCLPLAIWSGIFRIGVWEANSWLEMGAGLENLAILVFAVWSVFIYMVPLSAHFGFSRQVFFSDTRHQKRNLRELNENFDNNVAGKKTQLKNKHELIEVPFIKKRKYKLSIIVLSTLVYCIILAAFLALSTPNFGTLARYKVGFLPFLVFIVMIGNPVLSRFSRLAK